MEEEKSQPYEWQVGDLCTRAGQEHVGIIYRVIDIEEGNRHAHTVFFIKPIFTLLRRGGPGSGHRTTTHSCMQYECTLMTLLDLAAERMRFEGFIADETKRRS